MTDLTSWGADQIASWVAGASLTDHSPVNVVLIDSGGTDADSTTHDDWVITSTNGNATVENNSAVSFGDPSYSATITEVALRDGSGNTIAQYTLDSSKDVTSDVDELRFEANQLTFKVE